MPNNDLSSYTTAQLESMLAKMKNEKNNTGSTLTTNETKNAQKKINEGKLRFGRNIDRYKKKTK